MMFTESEQIMRSFSAPMFPRGLEAQKSADMGLQHGYWLTRLQTVNEDEEMKEGAERQQSTRVVLTRETSLVQPTMPQFGELVPESMNMDWAASYASYCSERGWCAADPEPECEPEPPATIILAENTHRSPFEDDVDFMPSSLFSHAMSSLDLESALESEYDDESPMSAVSPVSTLESSLETVVEEDNCEPEPECEDEPEPECEESLMAPKRRKIDDAVCFPEPEPVLEEVSDDEDFPITSKSLTLPPTYLLNKDADDATMVLTPNTHDDGEESTKSGRSSTSTTISLKSGGSNRSSDEEMTGSKLEEVATPDQIITLCNLPCCLYLCERRELARLIGRLVCEATDNWFGGWENVGGEACKELRNFWCSPATEGEDEGMLFLVVDEATGAEVPRTPALQSLSFDPDARTAVITLGKDFVSYRPKLEVLLRREAKSFTVFQEFGEGMEIPVGWLRNVRRHAQITYASQEEEWAAHDGSDDAAILLDRYKLSKMKPQAKAYCRSFDQGFFSMYVNNNPAVKRNLIGTDSDEVTFSRDWAHWYVAADSWNARPDTTLRVVGYQVRRAWRIRNAEENPIDPDDL